MQILPADGETLGEVMFRGNVVMKGYLKNKASTDKTFAGGWFHSGDLGVKHPDGYIQLKDRSKDIIISGGENISSIEVEDALFQHPAVQLAAVVARPDDKWGETPCAFVELKPGMAATSEELIAWCRDRLARYKCPRHVVFIEIPKTSTGKMQKFVAAPARASRRSRLAMAKLREEEDPDPWPELLRRRLIAAILGAGDLFPHPGEDDSERIHEARKALKEAARPRQADDRPGRAARLRRLARTRIRPPPAWPRPRPRRHARRARQSGRTPRKPADRGPRRRDRQRA